MGSMPDLCHDLKSQYPLLSYESVTKKDGSDYILIRSSLPEISRYLPHLNVVVESGVVKLLSYHGRILKEENFDGGIILEQLNEGKLFFCIGAGSLREGLEDSALKEVFSEPSTDGDIVYRSRSCSFFLEDTPGICYNCQMFLESLHKVHEDRGEETTVQSEDLELSNHKEDLELLNHKEDLELLNHKEDSYFEEDDDGPDYYDDDIWEEPAEIFSEEEESSSKEKSPADTHELPITCKVCYRKFSRKCSYDRHYRQHSSVKDKIFDFDEDNNKSDDKDDDWEETAERLSDAEELCPKCGKVFKETSIKIHLKKCKIPKNISKFCETCKVCLSIFKKKGSFTRHFNIHLKSINVDESIDCPLCKKSLDNRKCLNDHIHESHDSSKGCCVICFEMMPKDNLPKHMDRSHGDGYKKHLCPECGQKFKFPFELVNHIARYHDLGGDKYVVCEHCGKGFPHKRALSGHFLHVHDRSKTFPCDQCGKVFYRRWSLILHVQTHSGLKPYKCPLCNFYSATKSNVGNHVRQVHKNKKRKSAVKEKRKGPL